MKTLKDHVIIYDKECPMCDLYTNGFVKTGMLPNDGRVPFGETNHDINILIDRKRACNEIALVNKQKGEVVYGIESLFTIISNRYPFLKNLFQFKPFYWAMKKFYSFISYNRKVIVPGKVFEGDSVCAPTLNIKYRILYIIMTWFFTALVLSYYTQLLNPLLPPSSFIREFVVCGGQIVFQAIAVSLIRKDRAVHYLGNMMTVSLMGAVLLLPAFLFSIMGVVSPFVYAAWFMVVVAIMFFEHLRRVKILDIHWSISASWVIYRLIVLWILI